MALSNFEGTGSARTLVRLSGAHLYKQVLGNKSLQRHVVVTVNHISFLVKTGKALKS
ncbi:MAG: hypothetical protein ACPGKG_07930 [Paracoccaceae bacterium]